MPGVGGLWIVFSGSEPAIHDLATSESDKAQMTLRIDREVLDYSRDGGSGYQTRFNDVLRSFVAAHTDGRR